MSDDIGNFGDIPNDKYVKFFEKFKEINSLPVEQWKPNHMLAYFVKKYQETYNVPYKFKFNSPAPSKCFEVFQIKKLSMMLSSDPIILKSYMDWVFKVKAENSKRRLTSISFTTEESIVNNFKFKYLNNQNTSTISRSTKLPDNIKSLFKDTETYGDLAFIYQALRHLPQQEKDELNAKFEQIKDFDISILGKLK